ncbi:unnamed protein product [Musa acuminata subsp. burmannicoides]
MIKSLTGYFLVVCIALPRTVRPRSAAPCRLLVTSPLHSDPCGKNSNCEPSMCGLCQYIAGSLPPSILFAPLAIDLHPPTLGSHLDEAPL